jgi:hypothetical protein
MATARISGSISFAILAKGPLSAAMTSIPVGFLQRWRVIE